MRFTLALLGALISVTAAMPYTPPADNADGAYMVQFDARGNPITKRLDIEPSALDSRDAEPEPAAPGITVAEKSPLTKRNFPGNPGASCTGLTIPNDNSYSVVQNCLGTWLNQKQGTWVGANFGGAWSSGYGGVYYCRHQNTLLAVCLYNQGTIVGSSAEIDTFNGVMDGTCGWWKSGYVFIQDWNKTYWRTLWGEEVCGNIWNGERKQVFA